MIDQQLDCQRCPGRMRVAGTDRLIECLAGRGFRGEAAGQGRAVRQGRRRARRSRRRPPVAVPSFVRPGRIEVLGKHTDYAGGAAWSWPPSGGSAWSVAARATAGCVCRRAPRRGTVEFALDADLSRGWATGRTTR